MKLTVFFLCSFFSHMIIAQKVTSGEQREILEQIENLRRAHLKNDTVLVNTIYDEDLVLTSQSGKKYGKKAALYNIMNKYESYESSDFYFLKVEDNVVLTNYINERKFKGFDKGKFRLTVIWRKLGEQWKIISMQSSRIKTRPKN